MKIVIILAVASRLCLPAFLCWRKTPAQTRVQRHRRRTQLEVTYAPKAGGFGDLAASHAWEMSAVTCELDGKLGFEERQGGAISWCSRRWTRCRLPTAP